MNWLSLLTGVRETVVIVATSVGVVVAWRGLATWRRQLQGASNYEAARNMLRAIYRLRDTIVEVRTPVFYTWELETRPFADRTQSLSEEEQWNDLAFAYKQRWANVAAARREWQVALLEAEVLWGDELHPAGSITQGLTTELEQKLFDGYLPRMREANGQPLSDEWLQISKVVLSLHQPDEFGASLTKAIEQHERLLRGRLRRPVR